MIVRMRRHQLGYWGWKLTHRLPYAVQWLVWRPLQRLVRYERHNGTDWEWWL